MDQSTISSRGEHALIPMRDDQVQIQQSSHDPYEPQNNPDGYLQLLVAENKLNWMMLKNKILQTPAEDIPLWVASYGNMAGNQDFRESIAKMMQYTWIKAPVESQYINAQSGCGAILDCLAWTLCEPNDSVIVPGPIYPAFVNDFFQRAKVNLVVSPSKIENMYNPQRDELENTFQLCVKKKQQPKVLLICQPCNPTGLIYDRETLENMIHWALEKGIHVVSDEIYANSTFPDQTMISAADVMHERNKGQKKYLSDYVHIVAGLSKDFGVSGFRIGWLFSHNQKLLKAISNIGYFQSVSHLTQYLVIQLLEDKAFVNDYIIQNKKKLYQCYLALKDALDSINVSMLPAQGTLMVWADFRKYLKENTWEAELNLWMELFRDSKILFTTGKICYSQQPGFFRICYTYPNVTDEDCCIAMKELKKRLIKHFSQKLLI